jgi:hypothetical protein
MKPTEKIEINVNVIFSIKDQEFYIHVYKYTTLKTSKFITKDSLCFTQIYDVNQAANCIEKNNLVKRITPEYIYYENEIEIKR